MTDTIHVAVNDDTVVETVAAGMDHPTTSHIRITTATIQMIAVAATAHKPTTAAAAVAVIVAAAVVVIIATTCRRASVAAAVIAAAMTTALTFCS